MCLITHHILMEDPDFSDLEALTRQIEQGAAQFIQEIEGFLAKNAA